METVAIPTAARHAYTEAMYREMADLPIEALALFRKAYEAGMTDPEIHFHIGYNAKLCKDNYTAMKHLAFFVGQALKVLKAVDVPAVADSDTTTSDAGAETDADNETKETEEKQRPVTESIGCFQELIEVAGVELMDTLHTLGRTAESHALAQRLLDLRPTRCDDDETRATDNSTLLPANSTPCSALAHEATIIHSASGTLERQPTRSAALIKSESLLAAEKEAAGAPTEREAETATMPELVLPPELVREAQYQLGWLRLV